jgi:hypothetical protein
MNKDYKLDPMTGPTQNLFQTFCTGLDAAGLGLEPMMKAAARHNAEMLSLMSQRAQAYFEIPSRLTQCRTMQDIMTEQSRFWQTMARQYTESSQRMLTAWTTAGREAKKSSLERDYITFPEPQEDDLQASVRERRAA